jgi:hypothetical protein
MTFWARPFVLLSFAAAACSSVPSNEDTPHFNLNQVLRAPASVPTPVHWMVRLHAIGEGVILSQDSERSPMTLTYFIGTTIVRSQVLPIERSVAFIDQYNDFFANAPVEKDPALSCNDRVTVVAKPRANIPARFLTYCLETWAKTRRQEFVKRIGTW